MKEHNVTRRIELLALWVGVMFLYIYGDYFELYVPGKVDSLLATDSNLDTPGKLSLAAGILAIPALLIFLTVLLRRPAVRLLNIGFGAFFSLFTLLVGISSVSEWRAYYVAYAFLETAITGVIVWKSWTWRLGEAEERVR